MTCTCGHPKSHHWTDPEPKKPKGAIPRLGSAERPGKCISFRDPSCDCRVFVERKSEVMP